MEPFWKEQTVDVTSYGSKNILALYGMNDR